MKTNFFDKSFDELTELLKGLGQSSYRLEQVLHWAYFRTIRDFSGMTNIPSSLRDEMSKHLDLEPLSLADQQRSGDGTCKLLLDLGDGQGVETVLIPEEGYNTQCISTQAGCEMGCSFCETGRDGLARNLSRGEMLAQVALAARVLGGRNALRNLVFMGMGEPLRNMDELLPALEVILDSRGFNFSPRRVTVSTCGWIPGIRQLGEAGLGVSLAVSLNAADDWTRSMLMPVNRRYPIGELLEAVRNYPIQKRQRVTFEYVLIRSVNDGVENARKLARLVGDIPSKVNLIPCNENRAGYMPPYPEAVAEFQRTLFDSGVLAIVRDSRGAEISAACGQLRARAAGTGA